MIFRDSSHAERWEAIIKASGAVKSNGTVNGDLGASLFILTGLASVYDRAEQHIHYGWIDFEAILRMPLSTGEGILVSLAGNLYNGGFFDGYTPEDIVSHCDSDMVELAVEAIRLRKQKVFYSEVFGAWTFSREALETVRGYTEISGENIPETAMEFLSRATIPPPKRRKINPGNSDFPRFSQIVSDT